MRLQTVFQYRAAAHVLSHGKWNLFFVATISFLVLFLFFCKNIEMNFFEYLHTSLVIFGNIWWACAYQKRKIFLCSIILRFKQILMLIFAIYKYVESHLVCHDLLRSSLCLNGSAHQQNHWSAYRESSSRRSLHQLPQVVFKRTKQDFWPGILSCFNHRCRFFFQWKDAELCIWQNTIPTQNYNKT